MKIPLEDFSGETLLIGGDDVDSVDLGAVMEVKKVFFFVWNHLLLMVINNGRISYSIQY